jgi:hypothetical protein
MFCSAGEKIFKEAPKEVTDQYDYQVILARQRLADEKGFAEVSDSRKLMKLFSFSFLL